MKLGMLSWSGINMPWYKFCPIWGRFGYELLTNQSFSQTRASHNKPDGFGREHATFGDETISVASYCFQKLSSVNIEQHECCVKLWNFLGFVWTFYASIEFSMHLCA